MIKHPIRFGLIPILFFLPFFLVAQISADFTVDKTEGCVPLTLIFSDLSSSSNGSIKSWKWEMDNTFFSSTKNPSYLLNSAGLYSICLTVTNEAGQSDKKCKSNYLRGFAAPNVSFIADTREGCSPLKATFTSTSSTSNGQISRWIWDLGGTCSVMETNSDTPVECEYMNPGNYKPTLIVFDEKGCQASLSQEDFIRVHPDPDIQINSDFVFGCAPPFTINFSNDNAEANTTYKWDFGNGQLYTGPFPPAITYTGEGPYDIVVTAKNNQTGCEDTLVLDDYASAGYPIDFEVSAPGGCGDLNLLFMDLSPDAASSITWDFGDGNSSTFDNPSHSYSTVGCYKVILSREVGICTNTDSVLICVQDPDDLPLTYTLQNKIGCELPHTSTFQATSIAAETWLWDFGDGNTSTVQNPVHTYSSFGTFPVSLTITDALNCSKTIQTDTVFLKALTVKLKNNQTQGCIPLNFDLEAVIQSIVPLTSIHWEIRDFSNTLLFSSNMAQPNVSISQVGCFDIILEVENSLGCITSKTFPGAVCAGNVPAVNFSASPLDACANETIFFEDLSDNSVNAWAWDFDGDGDFDSFDPNPEYSYVDTGCFTVTLLVSSFGCENVLTLPDFVCIHPPVSKFNVKNFCEEPFKRSFVNKSIGADSVSWDFGVLALDSDTSSQFNPDFIFPAKDTFIVTQVSFNFQYGCTDTLTRKIIITEPIADFTIADDMGCAPMTLDITNNSIDANNYLWSAAGGHVAATTTDNPSIKFSNPGTFNLRLVVTDINACKDTFVYQPIYANGIDVDFASLQLNDCIPVDVQFTDLSSNLFANNIQFDWIFGDTIGVASGDDVIFTFEQVGFISTKLIVTDSWGCVDSLVVEEGIDVNAPFSDFLVDTFSCPGLNLSFENTSIGSGLTYTWDFGDGAISTLQDPDHLFNGVGDFEVALTIVSPASPSCTHVSTQTIHVEEVTAAFEVDPGYSACPPSVVEINSISDNAHDFVWTFGDNSGSSNLENPSHIYTQKGYYDIDLIAIGGNPMCTDTMSIDSLIRILGPSGQFSFTVEDHCLPAEVIFSAQSERPFDYTWFFDDGNTQMTPNSSGDNLSYIYNEVSDEGFIPKLLLYDSEGCDTVIISPDTINLSSLSIDFIASDTFLCDGENVVAFESMIESSEDDFQVVWSFPGGNPNSSIMEDVAIDYMRPGFFDVTLKVDNGHCQDTLSKRNYIEVVDLVNLITEDQMICLGDTVQLNTISNATEFSWTPLENISNSQDSSPYVYPSQTTDYVVSGNYKSCNTAVDTVRVEVFSLPEVTYTPVRRFFPDQVIMLEIKALDGVTDYHYQWFPTTGLSCANCANPTASLDTNMVYTITVTHPTTGCTREVSMEVRELASCPEDLIYMPTGFSPNEDGNNDYFRMYSSNIEKINYLRVYDRWGALIWSTTDINEGWDGTFNGKEMNSGIYVYVLEAPCSLNDRPILKKGSVMLLR